MYIKCYTLIQITALAEFNEGSNAVDRTHTVACNRTLGNMVYLIDTVEDVHTIVEVRVFGAGRNICPNFLIFAF